MSLFNIQPRYSNPVEKFGYKKLDLIQRFLKKYFNDNQIYIRNIEIQKKLELPSFASVTFSTSETITPIEVTTLIINYYSSSINGLYWNISVKPKVEKMIVDIFTLKNQGIDEVLLKNIEETERNYLRELY